jgi:hypothetical protein
MLVDYMFDSKDGTEKMTENLSKVRLDLINELSVFRDKCANKVLSEKLPIVLEKVSSLNPTNLEDVNITKFLLAIKVCEELTENVDE